MKYFVRINSENLSNDMFRAFGRGGLQLYIKTKLSNSSFDNIDFMIAFIFVHRYRVGVYVERTLHPYIIPAAFFLMFLLSFKLSNLLFVLSYVLLRFNM